MNVHSIDFRGLGGTDGPPRCLRNDSVVKPLAFHNRREFRIAESGNVTVRIQHDDARDDGTSEASSTDFVHSSHAIEAQSPQCVLERPPGEGSHGWVVTPTVHLGTQQHSAQHQPHEAPSTRHPYQPCFVSRIRAALPLRSRR